MLVGDENKESQGMLLTQNKTSTRSIDRTESVVDDTHTYILIYLEKGQRITYREESIYKRTTTQILLLGHNTISI